MIQAIATVFLTLLGVVLFIRYQRMVGQLVQEQSRCSDLYNRALAAEQAKAKAEVELDFIKQSVIQLLNRSVVATLNDTQVNNIVQALLQYANSVARPEKMN